MVHCSWFSHWLLFFYLSRTKCTTFGPKVKCNNVKWCLNMLKHDYQVGNLIITWIFRIIKYQWFENSNNSYGLKNMSSIWVSISTHMAFLLNFEGISSVKLFTRSMAKSQDQCNFQFLDSVTSRSSIRISSRSRII